jgi:hypothetical protein
MKSATLFACSANFWLFFVAGLQEFFDAKSLPACVGWLALAVAMLLVALVVAVVATREANP